MTKFFIDTEFIEKPGHLDLISIGIISENGDKYYAVNQNCDFSLANSWVKKNVIPALPVEGHPDWKNKETIAFEIIAFLKQVEKIELYTHTYESLKNLVPQHKIEIWGEWSSYDWVCFCWLFGAMADLPVGFPMRPSDIIQYCEDHLMLDSNSLPKSLEVENKHHALLGATTVRNRYYWLKSKEREISSLVIDLT